MPVAKNLFKAALADGRVQIGLWLGLAGAYTSELAAGSGFDWLVIDGEHAPNDIPAMLAQLQAIGARSHAVIRPPVGETWLIKQVLDLGAQTVLVPMVESAAQAEALVRAVQYAPRGVRGAGASLARAADFGRIGDYIATAGAEVCLLVQVESRAGLAALEAIAAVEGVDGVFIGPADLAADMGHPGNPGHPDVQAAIHDGIARILRAGKAPGILATTESQARQWLAAGALFVAVGVDTMLLVSAAQDLLARFRTETATPAVRPLGY